MPVRYDVIVIGGGDMPAVKLQLPLHAWAPEPLW